MSPENYKKRRESFDETLCEFRKRITQMLDRPDRPLMKDEFCNMMRLMFVLLEYLRDDDEHYEYIMKGLMRVILTKEEEVDIFLNAVEEFKKNE